MKKLLPYLVAGLTLAATSCKKDDDKTTTPSSRSELIKGTWKLSEYGLDANSNGTLDAGESAPASTAGIASTQTFNADGSGVQITTAFGSTDTVSFNWTLMNSDNTLRGIFDGDTTDFSIKELTSNRFVLLDPTTITPTWNVLTK